MIILLQQVVAGVRLRLRRVGDVSLPDVDIETVINRLLLTYMEQAGMAAQNIASKVAEVEFVADQDDFLVSLAQTVPDFKEQKLEYVYATSTGAERWYEARIVPLQAWAQHFRNGYVAVSFYGGDHARFNIQAQTIAQFRWKLTYRDSLLTIVQTGERPPIPAAQIPMLELDAAIQCMPLVQDDSDEWVAWMSRSLPIYENTLGRDRVGREPATGLKALWRQYLDSSVEPQVQDVKRFNDFRRHGRFTATRGVLPIQ